MCKLSSTGPPLKMFGYATASRTLISENYIYNSIGFFYSEECLVIMIGKRFFGHGIHIYLSCYNMIYLCNLWDFESHEDVHIFFAYFFIISNDFQNLQLGLHKSKSSFKNNIFGVTYLVWLYLLASLFSSIE